MHAITESENKRIGEDRRKRRIPPLKFIFFGGRRSKVRREMDKQKLVLVDNYDIKMLIIILNIIGLSLADGIFTLILIDNGASEINPVMRYFLDIHPWLFMSMKFIFTCLGLLCMLVLSNTTFKPLNMSVRTFFPIILVLFYAVLFWQIYLKLDHIS